MAEEDSKIVRTSDNEIDGLDEQVKNLRFTSRYALLMETSGKESESWYYFIRYEGNEDNLRHLKEQIDDVDMYIMDDYSTYDIELENLVTESTAKEMIKLHLNSCMFHRKFDGKMQRINLGLKKNDSTERKIRKCFRKLKYGKIEDYVDGEDISMCDLVEGSSEEESSSSSSSEEEKAVSNPKVRKPPVLNKDLPRFAKKKRKH